MSQVTPNGVNNAVAANTEKKTEESGGIFGGIFNSKSDEAAGARATASVPVSQPEGSNVGAETESGGLFSGLLGSNNEEDKAKTVAENGVAKEEEKPGFFANLLKGENAPEAEAVAKTEAEEEAEVAAAAAAAATSGAEAAEEKKADVPLLDRMKGIFASPSDEKKDGNLDNISESEDEESDEESEDDGSDEDGSDEGDDEVELFLTKIKTLRSKCRKMKMKYRTLKGKYDEMKTKGSANGDNSDFTKVVASILAMEGLVKQNKLYIKEYAKKNNIQIEGFGLGDEDERSESEGEDEKLPKIEETLEETNETNEQPLSGSSSESGSGSESESGSGSGSGSESEEEGLEVSNPLEPVSVNSNESLPDSMGEDGTVNPEPTVPAPAPAAAPAQTAPAQAAPAQTAPAPAAPAPPSGQISGEIAKILGGRSHFVKKNHIKTYRHHNRRNRHKTLKNKA